MLKWGISVTDGLSVLGSRERDQLAIQLAAAQERIAELSAELERLSSRDRLGQGLLSLPTFRQHLELDLARARREHHPIAVLLLDIDGFRAINAEHGHACGDQVLAAVADVITTQTRSRDLACRMGADEFAISLYESEPTGAMPVAERILRGLEALEVGRVHGLSASLGVAGLEAGGTADDLIAAAGAALLAARAAGGGRVLGLEPGETSARALEEPANASVVAVLTSALEERDRYTGDHSMSLAELTARVAESLGLDAAQVEAIRTAAVLHDIGKIGIPDAILHKPGPLEEDEWAVMREHPAIGERIIRAIPGMGMIARIVRHEHERWDGAGYPDGLAGEEVPIGSRVILACDAYHAMVSDRPYRQAMAHSEAMAELHQNAGTQFDPQVVEALVGYLYGRRQAGLPTV
jgi:diguanylate cyclase (GGDEF)-like protein/putative nucleotidyltransferase with HDIG domain